MRVAATNIAVCAIGCGGLLACWGRYASADTANEIFVERAFHDLLNRVPAESELSAWTAPLDAHSLTGTQVAGQLDGSDEYHVIEISQQYTSLLHRPADPGGVTLWENSLRGSGTVEQLQATLAGSQEYYTNRGGGTNDGFLTVLYPDLLARSIAPAERSADDGALASGVTRANLAAGILAGTEYDQRLVQDLFLEFLHRQPDSTARAQYVNLLQSGARDEQVIADLVGSQEYYQLPLLPGDANFDRIVGFDDLVILARNYGKSGAHWTDGDFSGDGHVGFEDLVDLARDYGQSLSAAQLAALDAAVPAPEPASCMLLLAATCACARRRRIGQPEKRQIDC